MARVTIKAPKSACGWLWCSQCRRAFRRGEYRQEESLQLCPYPDCSGDTARFAWPWDEVRRDHPKAPEIPIRDVTFA